MTRPVITGRTEQSRTYPRVTEEAEEKNRVRKEGVEERERETKRWEDVHSFILFCRRRERSETGGEAPCESEKRGLEAREKEGGSDLCGVVLVKAGDVVGL